MNSMKLKDKLKNISREKNIGFNTLLRLYMYDRLIERLSISKYKDNFVLKGGFRTDLLAEIDNIKEKFHIDIVTGDLITPKEISYKYKPLLKENYINIWAYNIETVLAEKFETILSRLELNGRMRDFYDIYLIYTKDWNNININNFRKAITNTFNKREYNSDISKSLDIIRKSVLLRKRWNVYRKKYAYAKDITFDEIIECLDKILEMIIPISI